MAANNVSTKAEYSFLDAGLTNLCAMNGYAVAKGETLAFPVFVVKTVCVLFLLLTCPFTISLNLLVILAVQRKRYLRKKYHVLLACLAGTDLLAGAITQPLLIIDHTRHIMGIGSNCLVDNLLYFSYVVTSGASTFHLAIISGERYVAIKHALRYETLVTTRRSILAVVLAWLLPACLYSVMFCFFFFGDSSIILIVVAFTAPILTILLFSISFCQYAVYRECRRHVKHIRLHSVSELSARDILQKHKAAKTTSIIVLALFLCFVPQIVFYGVVLPINSSKTIILSGIGIMDVLVIFTSFINPVIYCSRTQEFRRATREFLRLKNSATHIAVGQHAFSNASKSQSRVHPL